MKNDAIKKEIWDYVEGIGELWMEIILVFGNEPVLFVCKDNYDSRYLIMTYDDGEGVFVISPSSCDTIFKMITNIITLREAFTSSEYIFLTEWEEDRLISKKCESKSFYSDMLPREGATFDLRGKEIDDYSRKLYKELSVKYNIMIKRKSLQVRFIAAVFVVVLLAGTVLGIIRFQFFNLGTDSNGEIIVKGPVQEDDGNFEKSDDLDENDGMTIVKEPVSLKITKAFKTLVVYAASLEYPIQGEQILEAAGITEDETIATSIDGQEEYTASQLIDQKVIMAYKDDGHEVFFQGQYNERFHWDGECLINSYKDGALFAATVAVYNDGKRVKYEQLLADETEWNYTARDCEGDINIGDSLIYSKNNEIKQRISFEEPKSEAFINPADYSQYIGDGALLKVYHGYTFGGKFNDDTGNAYLISYDNKGYVKTLYCGGITNGRYNDTTGRAWYITRNPEKETKYEYFSGIFRNGQADKDNSNPDYITKERIEEVTQGKVVEDYLKWDWEYVVK